MWNDFVDGFKHAFAIGPDPKRSQELPAVLERFAEGVVARRLEIPALVMLETVTPLNFLASQVAAAFMPILKGFMSTDELAEAAEALEDRTAVRRLAERIEQLAQDASPC